MTLIYGEKLQAWGEKCCYLTFIKMLAVVFLLLIIALLLALGLIIRALSWSNLYDVKGFFFMKRNIFLHDKKSFFS